MPDQLSRKLALLALAVLLLSLACGASLGASASVAETQAALAHTQTALAASPTPSPSATPEPPSATPEPSPTPRPPTDTPEVAGPIDFSRYSSGNEVFKTAFDAGMWERGWIDFAFSYDGYPSTSKENSVSMGDGSLSVGLDDPNQQVFILYEYALVPRGVPIYIETEVDNLGPTRNNNIGLLCRISPTGWYEFSISSSGLWFIWRYDDGSGYWLLTNGGLQDYDINVTTHTLGASCNGDLLTVYIDGVQPRGGSIRDTTHREGFVGLAVFVGQVPDVNVAFDYFSLSIP